jgi:hypothetical protein
MIRTEQTIYIEVVVEEISIKTASEEAVSGVVDLIIDIIYHYCSLNKRSIVYIENLNVS